MYTGLADTAHKSKRTKAKFTSHTPYKLINNFQLVPFDRHFNTLEYHTIQCSVAETLKYTWYTLQLDYQSFTY